MIISGLRKRSMDMLVHSRHDVRKTHLMPIKASFSSGLKIKELPGADSELMCCFVFRHYSSINNASSTVIMSA